MENEENPFLSYEGAKEVGVDFSLYPNHLM